MNITITDYPTVIAFWLAFSRFVAVIIQLPLFDEVAVPVMVKTLAALMITFAFFPFIQGELLLDIQHVGMNHFWILTIFHTLIGLSIGFFVKCIMQIFAVAGEMVTQQVGFASAQYFDPSIGKQASPIEIMIHWTVLIIVVSSGALLPMFKGIYNSFFSIHIYNLGKFAHSLDFFMELFKTIFLSGILLATPLIVTNLIVLAVLGVISKTVPQMNVIMVSFVINIGLGLLVFISTSDEFFQMSYKIYVEQLGKWFQFVS